MDKPLKTSGDQRSLAAARRQPRPPQRILVAEDEEVIRDVYARVLMRSGYQVDTAEDGHEAWKTLQAASYDLLITDNQMPKVSGVELIRKIHSTHMDLPIILASGAVPINTESLELAAILPKPFAPDDLVKTVKEVLQRPVSNSAAPKLKKFARRLLAYEAAARKPGDEKNSAAFRVCEKLRGPLGKLMGAGGFRSLLGRSVALAGAEAPWLRELQIEADGALKGVDQLEAKLDWRAVAEGEVLLVSKLIELLVTFIGPALTLQLLRAVWPKMKDLNFESKKSYEEK